MKCTIEGNNARVIAKAIQSLSKVGRELFVEADSQGLQIRAINPTHSAVASIRFRRGMFETFQLPASGDCYCKITMKSCLTVFRNMKQVEHCEISVTDNQTKFQIKLRCKLETTKQAILSIVDEQNITAALSTDNSPNTIRGDYKLFMEISNSFNTAEEELTLEAKSDSLAAKNYIEGARVNDKFMRSQLKLKPSEFDLYNITQETNITFCLKEFRAFLGFAETLSADMTLEFEESGSPCFLKMKKHNDIECLLIMSTLSPDDVSFSEEYCQRDMTVPEAQVTQKRKSTNPPPAKQNKRRLAENTTISSSSDAPSESLFQFKDRARPSQMPSVEPARLLAEGDTIVNDEDDDQNVLLIAGAMNNAENQDIEVPPTGTGTEFCFYNTDGSPTTSVPVPAIVEQTNHNVNSDDDEDEENIPASPERRENVRRIFARCFQNTFVPREPSPNSQIYAPNSDTED